MIIKFLKQQIRDANWYTVPVLLFCVNLMLKLWHITSRDIAMDEPFTIFHAQAGLTDLFIKLKEENNPPLFFVLLHFWIKVFGVSPFSVRFLPVLFSSLTAPVIFLLGKRWFSATAAWVAALLFTFSDYHMVFAHEARVYPLFVLLTSLSMLILFSDEIKNPRSTLLIVALVNALMLYSHFFGFLVMATQAAMLFSSGYVRRRALTTWLWSLPVTLLFYSPYVPWLILRFTDATGHGTWVAKPVFSDLYTMIWRYSNAPVVTVIFLMLLIFSMALVIYRHRIHHERFIPFLTVAWTWFLVPYLAMFLVSFRLPLFLDRYTIFITPAWYLLIGVSATLLIREKVWKYLLPLLVVACMIATFHPDTDNRRRLREAVTRIDSLRTPGSLVLICPSWLEYGYAYHHNQELFKDYHGLHRRLNGKGIFPVDRLAMVDTGLLRQAPSVIYFEEWAGLTDTDNSLFRFLEARFPVYSGYRVFENYTIHHFTR